MTINVLVVPSASVLSIKSYNISTRNRSILDIMNNLKSIILLKKHNQKMMY